MFQFTICPSWFARPLTNYQYFPKIIGIHMGGVLRYGNGRSTAIQMGCILQYKCEEYWEYFPSIRAQGQKELQQHYFSTFSRSNRGWRFWQSSDRKEALHSFFPKQKRVILVLCVSHLSFERPKQYNRVCWQRLAWGLAKPPPVVSLCLNISTLWVHARHDCTTRVSDNRH